MKLNVTFNNLKVYFFTKKHKKYPSFSITLEYTSFVPRKKKGVNKISLKSFGHHCHSIICNTVSPAYFRT